MRSGPHDPAWNVSALFPLWIFFHNIVEYFSQYAMSSFISKFLNSKYHYKFFILIFGTYLALIQTAWPTIYWPNGMLLSSSLLENSVKLMVRSSFAWGRIFRLRQFFWCCPVRPPFSAWEHNNRKFADDCKVWYGCILESAGRDRFERQKTFKKWSGAFKKRMVGAASWFCGPCCQVVEKIQNGYKSIFSTEINVCLSLLYFNISQMVIDTVW